MALSLTATDVEDLSNRDMKMLLWLLTSEWVPRNRGRGQTKESPVQYRVRLLNKPRKGLAAHSRSAQNLEIAAHEETRRTAGKSALLALGVAAVLGLLRQVGTFATTTREQAAEACRHGECSVRDKVRAAEWELDAAKYAESQSSWGGYLRHFLDKGLRGHLDERRFGAKSPDKQAAFASRIACGLGALAALVGVGSTARMIQLQARLGGVRPDMKALRKLLDTKRAAPLSEEEYALIRRSCILNDSRDKCNSADQPCAWYPYREPNSRCLPSPSVKIRRSKR